MTDGYRAIMTEVRISNDGDSWGTVMEWLFSIAEVAYVLHGVTLPEFSPSPFLRPFERSTLWDSGHATDTITGWEDSGTVTLPDLRRAFTVLSRYADMLRAAGKDY